MKFGLCVGDECVMTIHARDAAQAWDVFHRKIETGEIKLSPNEHEYFIGLEPYPDKSK